jgi:hypothetical protein
MTTLDDAISFVSWHAQCDWDPLRDPLPAECAEEAKLLLDLSLSYGASFEEIMSKVRTATFGPQANDPGFIDPRLELLQLRCQMEQDADFLRNNADLTVKQAMAIWRTAQRYCELLTEHAPSPEARAKYATSLREHEAAMARAQRGERPYD